MSLKWTDSLDIAIELFEKYPDIDPTQIRFTELRECTLTEAIHEATGAAYGHAIHIPN